MIGRAVPGKKASLGKPPVEEKRARLLSPRQFTRFLKPDLYLPDLTSDDRTDVLSELACALQKYWTSSECDCMEGLLVAREELGTTALGKGLAVPHIRTALVTNLTVVVGRSNDGIPYRAPDGKRAHIFFLVLGPHDDPGNMYLSFLSTLVSAFVIRGLKGRLLKAATFEEFVAVMEGALSSE